MERYSIANTLRTDKGKRYNSTTLPPTVTKSDTDIYIITTIGDRLDSIAYSYYKDPELWWVISVANNHITKGSIFPQPGTQLRVPTNISNILILYIP
mgnify:CR=1 FL=1